MTMGAPHSEGSPPTAPRDALTEERDTLLEQTNAVGISTRPIWTLMHRLPHFADAPRMPLPIAEKLEQRVINLPSSASLATQSEQRALA